jgi:hypothetical protein
LIDEGHYMTASGGGRESPQEYSDMVHGFILFGGLLDAGLTWPYLRT